MKCKYCKVQVIKRYVNGIEILVNKKRVRKRLYNTNWLERVPHNCDNIKDMKTENDI